MISIILAHCLNKYLHISLASMAESCRKATQILSFLYLGSKYDAKNESWLKSADIRYVINATPPRSLDPVSGTPNYFQKDKRYKYKRIPIFDNQGEDLLSHLDVACAFIDEGKHYGSVLVHCHRGISRSASIVIAYLMKYNDFTCAEAIDFVKSCRPIIQPNETFLAQLLEFEKRLGRAEPIQEASSTAKPSVEVSEAESVFPPEEALEAKSILGKRPPMRDDDEDKDIEKRTLAQLTIS
jgi:hypothetical protein